MFRALENLETEVDINSARKTVRRIQISAKESLKYYKLKGYEQWFNEGC
jgi:hypothetical protein